MARVRDGDVYLCYNKQLVMLVRISDRLFIYILNTMEWQTSSQHPHALQKIQQITIFRHSDSDLYVDPSSSVQSSVRTQHILSVIVKFLNLYVFDFS